MLMIAMLESAENRQLPLATVWKMLYPDHGIALLYGGHGKCFIGPPGIEMHPLPSGSGGLLPRS